MIEHDFSQLPAIGDNEKLHGLITSDSILSALNSFNVKIEALTVSDALTRADKFYPEDDLFDVLDRLQVTYAVLIIDREEKLVGIITNYDSSEYFRRRAEDMMWVEDIEGTLKDYIRIPFTNADELDKEALNAAVQQIFSSKSKLQQTVNSAIHKYLKLHSQAHEKIKPDHDLIKKIVSSVGENDQTGKTIDDLTMNELITLFLHKDRWPEYQRAFNMDRSAIHTFLNKVREARNVLAHFKGDLTPTLRDHLRNCATWLDRNQ